MPFSPSDITGLVMYEADTNVYKDAGSTLAANNETVRQVSPSYGSGSNLVESNASLRPTLKTNVLNGKPVLRFTSSSFNALHAAINTPAPFTVLVVGRYNGLGSAAQGRILSSTFDGNNWALGWLGNQQGVAYFEGYVRGPTGDAADTDWHLYLGKSDGATSKLYEGSTLLASNSGGVTGPNGISVGGWINSTEAGGGSFSDCDWAVLAIVPSSISDADRASLVAWVTAKWLTVGPPSAGTASVVSTDKTNATLSWTDASGGQAPITAQLQRSAHGANSWSNVSGATSSPATDTGLTAGTTYDYRVVYTDSSGTPQTATSATIGATTWDATAYDPLEQQFAAADTLEGPFDWDVEKLRTPGVDGWAVSSVDPITYAASIGAGTAGKYLKGITFGASYCLWKPTGGRVPVDEFTIEVWASDPDWTTAAGTILSPVYSRQGSAEIYCSASGGTLTFTWVDRTQATPYNVAKTVSVAGLAAGTFHSFCFILSGGQLKLYVNRVLQSWSGGGTWTGIPQPALPTWGEMGQIDGLCFGGRPGQTANGFTLSDLHVRRFARTVGQTFVQPGVTTLTVSPGTPTGGTINQQLRGVVKEHANAFIQANNWSGACRAGGAGAISPVSTVQDAAHPTAGAPGSPYFYDHAALDATLDQAALVAQRGGGKINLNFGFCPQSLTPYTLTTTSSYTLTFTAGGVTRTTGSLAANAAASTIQAALEGLSNVGSGKAWVTGSAGGPYRVGFDVSLGTPWSLTASAGASCPAVVPPLTGTGTTGSNGGGNEAIPYDSTGQGSATALAAFGQYCKDHLYHAQQRGNNVVLCSLWNEPTVTQSSLNSVYGAFSDAIDSIGSGVLVGGCEFVSGTDTRIDSIISYSAANNKRLDFISYHDYSSDVLQAAYVKSTTDALFATAVAANPGWTKKPSSMGRVDGEMGYLSYNANAPSTGQNPYVGIEIHLNDFGGTYYAHKLIAGQLAGLLGEYAFKSDAAPSSPVAFDDMGLTSTAHQYTGSNVDQMFSMMPDAIVALSPTSPWPGVLALAAKAANGDAYLLVSYFAPLAVNDVTVPISFGGSYGGHGVTHYVVGNDAGTYRSDYFDGGASHEQLESVSSASVNGSGSLSLTLSPRSVHLLKISATASGGAFAFAQRNRFTPSKIRRAAVNRLN